MLARSRVSQEKEREELARLVHDDISQRLTALTLELALLQRRLGNSHEEGEKIAQLISQTTDINKAVRKLTNQLRPKVLDTFGLIAALRYECQLRTGDGVECTFSSTVEEVSLPSALRIEVFRLFQGVLKALLCQKGVGGLEAMAGLRGEETFFFWVQTGSTAAPKECCEDWAEMGERASWIGGELIAGEGYVEFKLPVE
ncbi:MAG: sensor histidine kinase [Limisphaerales bacterium]